MISVIRMYYPFRVASGLLTPAARSPCARVISMVKSTCPRGTWRCSAKGALLHVYSEWPGEERKLVAKPIHLLGEGQAAPECPDFAS